MGPIALPGTQLVWLAPSEECAAFRKMFPGKPRSLLEIDLGAAIAGMKADLAAEVWRPMRWIECVGPTRRRGFIWLDALGRQHGIDWIDPAPLPFSAVPVEWPKYPNPTTAAERQRVAA